MKENCQNSYNNSKVSDQNYNPYNSTGVPNNVNTQNQCGNVYNNTGMPNQYGNYYNGMPNQYNPALNQWQTPPKKKKHTALIVVLAIVLPLLLIIGTLVFVFVNLFSAVASIKDSEQYDLAYSYIINSETAEMLDVAEDDIKCTGYQTISSYSVGSNGHGNRTEFTFDVDGCKLVVVCHKDNDKWYVCEDCTKFK